MTTRQEKIPAGRDGAALSKRTQGYHMHDSGSSSISSSSTDGGVKPLYHQCPQPSHRRRRVKVVAFPIDTHLKASHAVQDNCCSNNKHLQALIAPTVIVCADNASRYRPSGTPDPCLLYASLTWLRMLMRTRLCSTAPHAADDRDMGLHYAPSREVGSANAPKIYTHQCQLIR